jgi:hypothetical protein
LLYQSGKPEWLRGFWGYARIRKWGRKVRIVSDRILSTPLILDGPTRNTIAAPFLKGILRVKKRRGTAYRKTYASISEEEFNAFVSLMNKREKVVPRKARSKTPERIAKRKAADAFRKWAVDNGWVSLGPAGYPDLLAEFPNHKIAAFEAKLYSDEDLRDTQEAMFPVLKSTGLTITTLRNVRNSEAAAEIRRNHWKVIAKGEGRITKGWPDFILKRGRRIVAVELKTGPTESVSSMQIETLSALSTQLHIEVHIVRAIEEDSMWSLYDDTERWLLYPS